MADALTPDGVRTRQFDVALRGYDRAQVDAFLAQVASRLDELERSVDEFDAVDPALGIDDREALARELHLIGGEVGDILEAARSAAERMRSRAAADAEAWTTDAREQSDAVLSTAREQSHAARASAWKEGTALLASAAAEAAAMLDDAKEETLFVRAEAEREALRHTGDAKRDREETIRAARAEAEAIIEGARAESEAVLTAAHQQAEQAQERARALEDRRAELLAELEAARASISDMENEIETKRQELEAPVPEVDLVDAHSHHDQDGGSVRIVAPSAVVPLAPVDAEELVAEVTALRAAPSAARPMPVTGAAHEPTAPAADAVEPSREPEMAQVGEDAPTTAIPDAVPADAVAAEAVPAEAAPAETTAPEPTAPEPTAPEPTPTGPTPAESATDGGPAVTPPVASPVPTARSVAPPVDAAPPTPVATSAGEADGPRDEADDDIDSLFAQLRSRPASPDGSDAPDAPGSAASTGASTGIDVVAEHTTDQETVDQESLDGQTTDHDTADAGHATVPGAAQPPDDDEARMVTARNAALRTIKRSLVELQNETLEHLRTDGAWMPSEDFTDRFHEPFADLAATLTGVDDAAAGSAFGTDLFDAVTSAIERARSSGAGEREVAAAASKVFRMWRSDEAERRVIDAATVSV